MNNIGNEKSRNRVIGNIVPSVPGGEKLGPNQFNINHLGEEQ